ncbi:MAG: hypothetical protein PWK00_06520, partial [Coxiella burnetii]|nr:hypothetical protein [Coxiella burnetii]
FFIAVPNNSKSLTFATKPTVVNTHFLLVKQEFNSVTQVVASGRNSVYLFFSEGYTRCNEFARQTVRIAGPE